MGYGMNEVLKNRINNLEILIDTGGIEDIKSALKEYDQARIVAKMILLNTQPYDDFLINNRN